MRAFKGLPLYPVLLAIFPALSLYVYNLQQVRLNQVVFTILFLVIASLVILFAIQALVRDPQKSALIAGVWFLLFFSYGHVNTSVSYLFNAAGMLDETRDLLRGTLADNIWLATWACLLVLFILIILKYPKDLSFANRLLSLCSVVALLSVVVSWAWAKVRQPTNRIDQFISDWMNRHPEEALVRGDAPADPLPDIYYIILDGLPSERVLREYYQTDLAEFRAYLEGKGFYIAGDSWTNYSGTDQSLTSSLNFMYLDELKQLGPNTSDLMPLEIMTENNRLFAFLHGYGYQTMTFADEYALTEITSADFYQTPQHWVLNAFQNELVNITPVPALTRVFSFKSAFDRHREEILFMYENLYTEVDPERPRIVFAHFLVPHPPFVFGANGEPVAMDDTFSFKLRAREIGRDKVIAGFRDQVHFATTRLIPELDKILSLSKRPVIILIQGDHGSGLNFDWDSLENTDLNERMPIFNAYYFYDRNYSRLSPDISPVNSFRVILDQYFGLNLPLLENHSYFLRVYHPYDFLEVTNYK
jgi:hypothetical protein